MQACMQQAMGREKQCRHTDRLSLWTKASDKGDTQKHWRASPENPQGKGPWTETRCEAAAFCSTAVITPQMSKRLVPLLSGRLLASRSIGNCIGIESMQCTLQQIVEALTCSNAPFMAAAGGIVSSSCILVQCSFAKTLREPSGSDQQK